MAIPYAENRDRGTVRNVTYGRQNFNTESMESNISNTAELEASGSGVDMVLQS